MLLFWGLPQFYDCVPFTLKMTQFDKQNLIHGKEILAIFSRCSNFEYVSKTPALRYQIHFGLANMRSKMLYFNASTLKMFQTKHYWTLVQ